MSRDLPPRPNLDHLKKQAKELLQTLRQQSPDAQLADAQHALARDYGFASWPRLKAHVEGEQNPFVGKWTADISRSKLHPLNRLQAASVGFDIQGADVTIDFDNWREVNGVKFAFDINEERTGKEPVVSLVTYTEKIEANVPLDDAFFATPAGK